MGVLDGKVAFITGAGSGIGRAGAIRFAREGAKVVVAEISREGGEKTVALVREQDAPTDPEYGRRFHAADEAC